MGEWYTDPARPGYRCKKITHNGATITIYRPICTEDQAAENEQRTRADLEAAMRGYYARQRRESLRA